MAGAGNRGGGGRGSGGKASSGESAQDRYKMQKAEERFKAGRGDTKYLPEDYAPRFTRRPRGR